MKEINRIIKQRVPALEQSKNYTLIPFSPLSMKTEDWQHILPVATKKKLIAGATKILQVLRMPQPFIEFSPAVVDIVMKSAFGRETAGGMRTINTYWFPLSFETIKFKCPRTCSLFQELYIDTDGKNWTCHCQSLVSWQRLQNLFLGLLRWANENDDTLDKIKSVLFALF